MVKARRPLAGLLKTTIMSKQLKQQHEQLLAKIPDNNSEWVAQQLLLMPAKERHIVLHALRKLDKALYKSWAKDMPLNEIMEAVKMISKDS